MWSPPSGSRNPRPCRFSLLVSRPCLARARRCCRYFDKLGRAYFAHSLLGLDSAPRCAADSLVSSATVRRAMAWAVWPAAVAPCSAAPQRCEGHLNRIQAGPCLAVFLGLGRCCSVRAGCVEPNHSPQSARPPLGRHASVARAPSGRGRPQRRMTPIGSSVRRPGNNGSSGAFAVLQQAPSRHSAVPLARKNARRHLSVPVGQLALFSSPRQNSNSRHRLASFWQPPCRCGGHQT